jgi:subtilisin family serine protease
MASSKRLVNAIYVRLPSTVTDDTVDKVLSQIEGVKEVSPHGSLEMEAYEAVDYLGGFMAKTNFCATGEGVRIAVLDGGIDYTHKNMGGPGTIDAYRAAYGNGPRSAENRQRDGLFPTENIVDGYDYVGESSSIPLPDDDPIDSFGHGTAVADAILSIAPNAKLIALKVCSPAMACPVYGIVQALEFALDPNGDNNLQDRVDIINLSLGIPFLSSFYNFVAATLEKAAELGVLPVVAAGNSGNIPYISGGISGGPNVLTVGATGHPNGPYAGTMALYSSRGPGENNFFKPEIVASSGLSLAAAGTGTFRYREIRGTSFSAPLVSGAAALVKERCPDCSPFAVKALILNNADRVTRYFNDSLELSPVTLSGAGEMRINKTLDADVWAYSLQDVQPSISLGLINAATDIVIRRTIKVINLAGFAQTLDISHEFRNLGREYSQVLRVEFNATTVSLSAECSSEVFVEVAFHIDASKAPPNIMTSTGRAGFNAKLLDHHEFGGHVVLSSRDTAKDIGIPFLAIIRQASNVTVGSSIIEDFSGWPTQAVVNLYNGGAGIAQIDAFQLLHASEDNPESPFGGVVVPNDFRYIGYRTLSVGVDVCASSFLVEFAVTTFERKMGRLFSEIYSAEIDHDGDLVGDVYLFNNALGRECVIADLKNYERRCTGFPPDHSTSSASTVIRACAEDLGLTENTSTFNVRFEAITFTSEGQIIETDRSGDFIPISFPRPEISAPSYDIYPGETLKAMELDGIGSIFGWQGENENTTSVLADHSGAELDPSSVSGKPLGLMLVTSSYRTPNRTGAATPMTETLLLLHERYNISSLPRENTTDDVLAFPKAKDVQGPDCSWKEINATCVALMQEELAEGNFSFEVTNVLDSPMIDEEDSVLNPVIPFEGEELQMLLRAMQGNGNEDDDETLTPWCPLVEVPRAEVPTRAPTAEPEPTEAPTQSPSFRPSTLPTVSLAAQVSPTAIPVMKPPSQGLRAEENHEKPEPISVGDEQQKQPPPQQTSETESGFFEPLEIPDSNSDMTSHAGMGRLYQSVNCFLVYIVMLLAL